MGAAEHAALGQAEAGRQRRHRGVAERRGPGRHLDPDPLGEQQPDPAGDLLADTRPRPERESGAVRWPRCRASRRPPGRRNRGRAGPRGTGSGRGRSARSPAVQTEWTGARQPSAGTAGGGLRASRALTPSALRAACGSPAIGPAEPETRAGSPTSTTATVRQRRSAPRCEDAVDGLGPLRVADEVDQLVRAAWQGLGQCCFATRRRGRHRGAPGVHASRVTAFSAPVSAGPEPCSAAGPAVSACDHAGGQGAAAARPSATSGAAYAARVGPGSCASGPRRRRGRRPAGRRCRSARRTRPPHPVGRGRAGSRARGSPRAGIPRARPPRDREGRQEGAGNGGTGESEGARERPSSLWRHSGHRSPEMVTRHTPPRLGTREPRP